MSATLTKAPYAPLLEYLCEDPDCCDNGSPRVTCRVCGEDWPCSDYVDNHTAGQVTAQRRYVLRKVWGFDEQMIDYSLRRWDAAGIRW